MPELTVSKNSEASFRVQISQGRFQIGRSVDNDLTLPDEEISRKHASIFGQGGQYRIRDEESVLGVQLNGKPVNGEAALTNGSVISIGAWTLKLRLESAADQDREEDVTRIKSVQSDDRTKILKVSPGGEKWTVECPALEVAYSDGSQKEITLRKSSLTVGSDPKSDLVLTDDYVSARHCRIVAGESGWKVEDLNSTNGTFINGNKIKEALLLPGTPIQVGHSTLVFKAQKKEEPIAPGDSTRFCGILGQSLQMRRLFTLLSKVAPTDHTVLVRGPTGSGKELISRAVHTLSKRANGPYVILNCGAISPNLIESELFGHEKGSFTGAANRHVGAFEEASGGTLFLDEIGELPLELQPKLLRVLENRTIRRVGSNAELPVDVRIVAATHRNLADWVKEGKFREDLYFRLQVIPVSVPPLADRKEDIPLLVEHFIRQASPEAPVTVDEAALEKLKSYDWPGNIRELKNVLMRALIFADGNRIGADNIEILRELGSNVAANSLEGLEKAKIEEILEQTQGNKTKAAEILGIAKSTLFKKLKDYGIPL